MAKINGKALVQSKTFWFNLLFAVVALAGLFGYEDFKPDVRFAEALGAVVTFGNVLLRLYTNKPITKVK